MSSISPSMRIRSFLSDISSPPFPSKQKGKGQGVQSAEAREKYPSQGGVRRRFGSKGNGTTQSASLERGDLT